MIRDYLGDHTKKPSPEMQKPYPKEVLRRIIEVAGGCRCIAFKEIDICSVPWRVYPVIDPRRNSSMVNCHNIARQVTMSVSSKKTRKVDHIIESSACEYCAVNFDTDDLTSLASLNGRYHSSEKCIYRAEQGWNRRPFQTFQTAFITATASILLETPSIAIKTLEYALHERKS